MKENWADYFVKAWIAILMISISIWPEETGKLWRYKYDQFMSGWNAK